jgi:outer membrane biosynthesis protein TonB
LDTSWLKNYSSLLLEKIDRFSKLNLPKNEKGEVTLSFMVSRQGNLVDEPKVLDSSNPALAPWAVKTIKDSAPFPPLPKDFDKPNGVFSVTLSYE